tara:strand:+ start:2501 stop:2845 length:345 start_codon:yes stop_codon:yes gene_type:complete
MNYKLQEIKEHATELIKERVNYDKEYLNKDLSEIHHDIFNTDYYIIGRYQAERWLDNKVFQVIETIKEYEEFNFGELTTDITEQEHVVNMYVYIIGEQLIYNTDLIKDIKKGVV